MSDDITRVVALLERMDHKSLEEVNRQLHREGIVLPPYQGNILNTMTGGESGEVGRYLVQCHGCSRYFMCSKGILKGLRTGAYATYRRGMIFTGWIWSEPSEDRKSGIGGILGDGSHAGPWAVCEDCLKSTLWHSSSLTPKPEALIVDLDASLMELVGELDEAYAEYGGSNES